MGCNVLDKVEECIQKIESCTDTVARENSRELVQVLLDFHGKALERIVSAISSSACPTLLDELQSRDELVGQMLLLHGLHPQDTRTRVLGALEKVRPQLKSHGGNVELVGIEENRVKLHFQGSCSGCPSSAMTLKNTIEEAILEAAPEAAIEVV